MNRFILFGTLLNNGKQMFNEMHDHFGLSASEMLEITFYSLHIWQSVRPCESHRMKTRVEIRDFAVSAGKFAFVSVLSFHRITCQNATIRFRWSYKSELDSKKVYNILTWHWVLWLRRLRIFRQMESHTSHQETNRLEGNKQTLSELLNHIW